MPGPLLPTWRGWPAIALSALILASGTAFLLPVPQQQKSGISAPSNAAQYEGDKRTAEDRMADYALGLDYLTALLVVVAALDIWLLFKSDANARKSTEIAQQQIALAGLQSDILLKQKEIARLQFFAEHRPKLEIRFAQRLRGNPHLQGATRRIYVEFSVINTGTSAATITGSRVRLDWFYPDDVPNPDAMGGSDRIIVPRRLLVSARARYSVDVADSLETSFMEGFSEEPDSRLEQAKLILLGWVVYQDERGAELGDTRTTYFCRAYDPATERFATIPELSDWEFTH